MPRQDEQKRIERAYLERARELSTLVPPGVIADGEEPDFTIVTQTGTIGIEVTELLRTVPGTLYPPVAAAAFHEDVMRFAEEYYLASGAEPVDVLVYFHNDATVKRDKHAMARALADFVRVRFTAGEPTAIFERLDGLPDGFSVIRITSPGGPWRGFESGTLHALKQEEVAAAIGKKEALLPEYRARLPQVPIWLLIYTSNRIERSVALPRSIVEWTFPSGFDRLLFFTALEQRVIELQREPLLQE